MSSSGTATPSSFSSSRWTDTAIGAVIGISTAAVLTYSYRWFISSGSRSFSSASSASSSTSSSFSTTTTPTHPSSSSSSSLLTSPSSLPRPDSVELRDEQLSRNRHFFGGQDSVAVHNIENAFIIVVGVGGVGSHAAMMLLRAGVRKLRIIDFDQVSLSSLNRHAVATRSDVGTSKVSAIVRYGQWINPSCTVEPVQELFSAAVASRLLDGKPDYVLDCIDDVNTKADLLEACYRMHLPVLCSLGAGGKADPTKLRITDLSLARTDPLGIAIRERFRKTNSPLSVFSREGIEYVKKSVTPPNDGSSSLSSFSSSPPSQPPPNKKKQRINNNAKKDMPLADTEEGRRLRAEEHRLRNRQRAEKEKAKNMASEVSGGSGKDSTVPNGPREEEMDVVPVWSTNNDDDIVYENTNPNPDRIHETTFVPKDTLSSTIPSSSSSSTVVLPSRSFHGLQLTGITCVYSAEDTKVGLLPLDIDAGTGEKPEDFGALPGFRVRVLPVLGTMPALFGQTMAAYVLCAIAGTNYLLTDALTGLPPSDNILRKIHDNIAVWDRQYYPGSQIWGSIDNLRMDESDYLVNEIWHNRCAVTNHRTGLKGINLILTRWKPWKGIKPSNMVLMNDEDALLLYQVTMKGSILDHTKVQRLYDILRERKDYGSGSGKSNGSTAIVQSKLAEYDTVYRTVEKELDDEFRTACLTILPLEVYNRIEQRFRYMHQQGWQ